MKSDGSDEISILPFIMKAFAQSCLSVPQAISFYNQDQSTITQFGSPVHMNVGMERGGGGNGQFIMPVGYLYI